MTLHQILLFEDDPAIGQSLMDEPHAADAFIKEYEWKIKYQKRSVCY